MRPKRYPYSKRRKRRERFTVPTVKIVENGLVINGMLLETNRYSIAQNCGRLVNVNLDIVCKLERGEDVCRLHSTSR